MVRTSLPRKLILPLLSMPGRSRKLQASCPCDLARYTTAAAAPSSAMPTGSPRRAVQHGVRGAGLWRMKTSGERASSPQ